MASNFWALGRWTSRSKGQTSLAMSISSWLRRATLTAKFSSLSVRRRFGIKRKAEVCNGERVSRRYRNLWLVGRYSLSMLKPCLDKDGEEFAIMSPNDCQRHPSHTCRSFLTSSIQLRKDTQCLQKGLTNNGDLSGWSVTDSSVLHDQPALCTGSR